MNNKTERYTLGEVLEYVEHKYEVGTVTYNEEVLYQDFKWDGRKSSKRHIHTIKKLVREMDEENGF